MTYRGERPRTTTAGCATAVVVPAPRHRADRPSVLRAIAIRPDKEAVRRQEIGGGGLQ
ncbi:hypothetical protein OHT68_45780 [Streptomyces canus]|uniref:hypothetical protein n=1 Tax=Streptomyces canus TaxID=58343 RepID=UPI002E2997BC|nr:hypothetical protein [Streptomyces canus]